MPSQENTGNSYFGANTLRQLSWVLAAVILGLSAPIVARPSNSNNALMKGAAAYNLALASISLLLYLGLEIQTPRSRSEDDPRPSRKTVTFIAFKTLAWVVAFAVMFVAVEGYDPDKDERPQLGLQWLVRRKGGGGRGGGGRGGGGKIEPAPIENLAIACGVMGVLMFLVMMVYWLPAISALCRGYGEEETKRVYAEWVIDWRRVNQDEEDSK